MNGDGAGGQATRADSAGCLLVVAGYNDVSSALRSVTDEAVSRISGVPELGDFFEVRFVRLGWRPARGAGPGEALARLANALTNPTGSAVRHYFAVLAADRSASVVGEMLGDFGAHPVISKLPIRYRGLASLEDRRAPTDNPEPGNEAGAGPHGNVLVAAAGAWSRAGLIHEVQRFASELLPEFASGAQTGLTAGQLARLRPGTGDELTALAPPDGHDELSPVPEESAPHQYLPALRPAPGELAQPPRRPTVPRPGLPSGFRSGQRRDIVRIPGLWPPTRRRARPATAVPPEPEPKAQPSVLVFLALLGDEGMADPAAWRRGQSVLLELDSKLASPDRRPFRVQALRSAGDAGMTDPREAGRLTRHSIGRPADILDFPRVLNIIRTALKRDVTMADLHGVPALRPAVVFFAADAPFADALTLGLHEEIVSQAAVTWIVPERLSALLSPRFEKSGAQQFDDHPGIADQVTSQLFTEDE